MNNLEIVGGVDTEIKGDDFFKYVPTPPKPGEVMHCRSCADAMPPESFPKNKTLAKVLFKWQLCEECWNKVNEYIDRSTTGLLSDRGR